MTTAPAFRYAFAFGMLGLLGLAWGVSMRYVGAPVVWFGLAMLAVGMNYGFPQHFAIFRKSHGQLAWVRKVFLLPYLAPFYGIWHLLRLTLPEAPFAEVVPGFFLGRRLLLHEYPRVKTLVDLTAELDEHIPSNADLFAFPILDGAPAPPAMLREMARKIASSPQPIYLHCAQGHGRTSMVAAAVLIELGVVQSVPEALEKIRMVRPGAKPNAIQLEALTAAFRPHE